MSSPVDERVSDEIQALEAILMNDVVVKYENEVPHTIETVVHPSTGDKTDQQFVCVTLEVKLTPGYPDISPAITLRNPRGLDDQILAKMDEQIKEKLKECLGQPVVFELIDLLRESLTKCNLPKGQCVICLFGFSIGDVFTKTQCYHYFHSECLANHIIAGKKMYTEEFNRLPNWQRQLAPPHKQTCPVCRSTISFNEDELKKAPPSLAAASAPPFRLTPELRAMQRRMATQLARQIARGGVVGMGDDGPPPLTITTPEDNVNDGAIASCSSQVTKPEASSRSGAADGATTASPQNKPVYRGFNRRGKPGRRGAR